MVGWKGGGARLLCLQRGVQSPGRLRLCEAPQKCVCRGVLILPGRLTTARQTSNFVFHFTKLARHSLCAPNSLPVLNFNHIIIS